MQEYGDKENDDLRDQCAAGRLVRSWSSIMVIFLGKHGDESIFLFFFCVYINEVYLLFMGFVYR